MWINGEGGGGIGQERGIRDLSFSFFFLDIFSRMVPIFTSAGQWLPVIVRPDPLGG